MTTTKSQLRATLKSSDTEETIDVYFTRPLGLLWARLFAHWGVHPNVVTLASIVIGLGAPCCMAQGYGSWRWTLLGIFLLVWANIYDSADGQLARMTGQKTLWGRILDGFAGNLWFVGIYAAIALRMMTQPLLPWLPNGPAWGGWIWPVLALVGFGIHAPQSRLADYYRNVHLYFIKGEAGSELDHSAKLRQSYAATSWRGAWAWKLFLRNYTAYTAAQEQATPQFQRLKALLDARYGRALPEALVREFRAGSLPLMKWTNVLSFNWRALTLYAALLLGVEWPSCLLLYPLAEVLIFQSIYLYMRRQHEALSQRLADRLTECL